MKYDQVNYVFCYLSVLLWFEDLSPRILINMAIQRNLGDFSLSEVDFYILREKTGYSYLSVGQLSNCHPICSILVLNPAMKQIECTDIINSLSILESRFGQYKMIPSNA